MRSRPSSLAYLACLACLGAGTSACSDEESYIIVTVNGRPAVHDATNLKVTLSNSGTMLTHELPLTNKMFPVTFSISAPGRAGELGIQVDAVDMNGLLVGRGETTSTVEMPTANVTVETADFVINTDYAGDQFPSDDYEAHGFQVAAGSDGTWTAAYRDRCTAPCNMFARRFDKNGRPVMAQLAAGTNGFPISTQLTSSLATPAIATAGTTTAEVWDFDDPASTTVGVACRSIDASGSGIPNQTTVATDASTDVVSIAPLSNGNFAVAWSAFLTTGVIRAAIVKPDCSVLSAATTVSTTASARKVSVASTGQTQGTVMYAFVIDGGVRVRLANNTNTYSSPADIQFLPKTATEVVESVRVAPLGTGFAIVVRWALATGAMGPGRIELYRTTNTGAVIGSSILVSNKSGSDFGSSEAFGVATRGDGVLMIVWHSCLTNGDGSGCGVWGRAFRTDGTPLGPEIVIPTTTTGDQTNPSVAALEDSFAVVWKDDSGTMPDIAGSAIRGRIIYPN
jgi:hypothetical protein